MARPTRPENQWSKAELLAEIDRLRGGAQYEELQQTILELQVHQEELQAKHEQLQETQIELERARDQYEELFDIAPMGYAVLDGAGIIRQANLTAANLLGVERRLLLDAPLFPYVVEYDRRRLLDHIARCRRGELAVETELSVRSRRGLEIPIQLTTTPNRREPRTVFLTALVDLSERKRLEEERNRIRDEQTQLRHDEQLARAASAAKDRFLAVLSHELRTPLTPILLALETIRQHGEVAAPLWPAVNMIQRNVLLEKRLIDDLLDVSRIIQGKLALQPETLDLHALVRDVVSMLDAELRIGVLTVGIDLGADAHHLHGDPVRCRQVIWNVLNNAIRNTPAHGRIDVRTRNDTAGWVTVTIEDTGRGIAPAVLPKIFDAFEQDEELRGRGVGLGLGLPISKAIVGAHGGRIEVRSAGHGQGTRVTIVLPTAAAPATTALPATAPARTRKRHRVLLVEDNEDSATALAEILVFHGYEVRIARSVEEALRHIDETDIVVSDIGLPDGSGLELMRQICARHPLPAIALSGYGTSDDIRRSTEAGFQRHIVKPVEPAHLLDVLASLAAE
jgi:PAS domain S-box-containing protein